jgi:hypothetical protein
MRGEEGRMRRRRTVGHKEVEKVGKRDTMRRYDRRGDEQASIASGAIEGRNTRDTRNPGMRYL